jgi:hypothetical protein
VTRFCLLIGSFLWARLPSQVFALNRIDAPGPVQFPQASLASRQGYWQAPCHSRPRAAAAPQNGKPTSGSARIFTDLRSAAAAALLRTCLLVASPRVTDGVGRRRCIASMHNALYNA